MEVLLCGFLLPEILHRTKGSIGIEDLKSRGSCKRFERVNKKNDLDERWGE